MFKEHEDDIYVALASPLCMNMCNSRLARFENCVPHCGHFDLAGFVAGAGVSDKTGSGTSSPSSSVYRPLSIVFLM